MLTAPARGQIATPTQMPTESRPGALTSPLPAPSSVAVAAAGSQGRLATAYRLGSGDKVRLTVYNEEMLTGEFIVDGSGFLSLQLVGAIPAAGRTVPEVIALIQAALKNGGFMLNPSVAMEVLSYRPFYVIGEVKDPGKYAYVSDMTVLNAIAVAGGYTYRAQRKKVFIIRESDAERKEQPATPGDIVMPGDIVRVLERFF